MANATVSTVQRFDGWALRSASFVAATDNVLVTRLWWEADGLGGGKAAATRRVLVDTSPHANVGAAECLRQSAGRGGPTGGGASGGPGGAQWFNRSIGRDFRAVWTHPRSVHKTHLMRVAVGTRFVGLAGAPLAVAPAANRSSASVVTLRAGEVAVALTALHTNRDFLFSRDDDPDQPLRSVGDKLRWLAAADGAALAALETEHAAWWRRHWSASGVRFALNPDGQLSVAERMWYGTVYMLAVTNRVNTTIHTPPSGLWHNFYTSDKQGWPGYTTDINTQSPYFGAAAANHAETELAMIDLHDQFIPIGRKMSAAAYDCANVNGANGGGVLLPVEIAAYGGTKIWDDQGLKSNGLLTAMLHVNHGRLTGEVGGQVYRFVREIALFWQCYLVKVPAVTQRGDPSYVYAETEL